MCQRRWRSVKTCRNGACGMLFSHSDGLFGDEGLTPCRPMSHSSLQTGQFVVVIQIIWPTSPPPFPPNTSQTNNLPPHCCLLATATVEPRCTARGVCSQTALCQCDEGAGVLSTSVTPPATYSLPLTHTHTYTHTICNRSSSIHPSLLPDWFSVSSALLFLLKHKGVASYWTILTFLHLFSGGFLRGNDNSGNNAC